MALVADALVKLALVDVRLPTEHVVIPAVVDVSALTLAEINVAFVDVSVEIKAPVVPTDSCVVELKSRKTSGSCGDVMIDVMLLQCKDAIVPSVHIKLLILVSPTSVMNDFVPVIV